MQDIVASGLLKKQDIVFLTVSTPTPVKRLAKRQKKLGLSLFSTGFAAPNIPRLAEKSCYRNKSFLFVESSQNRHQWFAEKHGRSRRHSYTGGSGNSKCD
ncbi:MAG: hypothetical protein MKZ85_07325 [Pedosphaera sp.]|nr:hypothetical protein [Pedosphaera sp.]